MLDPPSGTRRGGHAPGAPLNKHASLTFPTWLALLALGVQLVLPLSVGIAIARDGRAPTWEAAAENLCSVAHPASHREKDGSSPSAPAGACALCAALNVMQAFTDAPVLALPLPVRTEPSRPVALHDAALAALPFSVYRSRAPPLVG